MAQGEETGFWTTCRELETIQGPGFPCMPKVSGRPTAGPSSTASNSTPLSFTKIQEPIPQFAREVILAFSVAVNSLEKGEV